MIETILPFALKHYQEIEIKLGIPIIQKAPVVLLHPSLQMKESFDFRMEHENKYLIHQDPNNWKPFFKMPFGTGAIDECYWMDLNKMTTQWQQYLQSTNKLINKRFSCKSLELKKDGVHWENIEAEKIIFCDGLNSMNNPYFKALPFAPNKGEALIIKVPGLPKTNIYKNNVSVVPWQDDLFWVGSSYEWSFNDTNPTAGFKEKMIHSLNQFMELPYEVVDHLVGIRPANTQRRPFVGLHPIFPQLGICNGMGTKGCSLAPYFTYELMEHMELGKKIEPEADINRFASILKEVK
jgi:hypothetical protein